MSQARQILGDAGVPHLISGHGLPEGNRHDHAFYLPEDADGDGRIDHLLIHVPGGLDELCLRVLGAITRLWNRDGGEWRMVFEGQGPAIRFEQDCPLVRESLTWRSLTPYLHPWHWKRSLGVPEQIRRECRERGWPEPDSIEPLDSVEIAPGLTRRAVQFHRFRSKRGLIQPDTRGSLVALTFDVPVRGPIALGFGCHFGLGLFVPA